MLVEPGHGRGHKRGEECTARGADQAAIGELENQEVLGAAGDVETQAEGHGGTVEPGHAAVRYTNPATGADVLPTIRAEMHRIARGAETAPVRETGSSVFQVFDGSGTVTVGDTTWSVTRGDLFVVPSWQPFSARSEAGATDSDSGALDLFRFSDSPVFEALQLDRLQKDNA